MDFKDIHVCVDKLYEEVYFNKVKVWAESMGLPGDVTARRILRTPSCPHNICKGKMKSDGTRCTRRAKNNGFCGYHREQFKCEQQQQIDWNRSPVSHDIQERVIIP